MIQKHPLVAFVVLAYAATWVFYLLAVVFPAGADLLNFLSVFGPAVGAVLVVGLTQGPRRVRSLLSALVAWKADVGLYAVVVLYPLGFIGLMLLFYGMFHGLAALSALAAGLQHFVTGLPLLAWFFLSNLAIVWGEELGWRGYLLPELQARCHPLLATLIVWGVWAVWHLPLFFIQGTTQSAFPFWVFALINLLHTIFLTWMYNRGNGNLFVICLLHAAINAPVVFMLTTAAFRPLVAEPGFAILAAAVIDLAVVAWAGFRLGLRPGAAQRLRAQLDL
ncbi:MAG TPA: type II CAAX endopeptidase family protein [Anaerolineaceae bacterium]|jgi:membrane protease YdiL (CAAX protease family)|nr:type II CAAX endopeptidase family protein [Anaerolineaceae bacterium]